MDVQLEVGHAPASSGAPQRRCGRGVRTQRRCAEGEHIALGRSKRSPTPQGKFYIRNKLTR